MTDQRPSTPQITLASSPPSLKQPRSNLLNILVRSSEEFRRAHPHRFADGRLLFVENVAHLLGCSIDLVRRIPRTELPAARIGQRLIYRREDVDAYVARRLDRGHAPEKIEGRFAGRSTSISFDPVEQLRAILQENDAR